MPESFQAALFICPDRHDLRKIEREPERLIAPVLVAPVSMSPNRQLVTPEGMLPLSGYLALVQVSLFPVLVQVSGYPALEQ